MNIIEYKQGIAGMSTNDEELGCHPRHHDVCPTMSSEANVDAVLRRPCAARRAICTRHCGTAPRRGSEDFLKLIPRGVRIGLRQILFVEKTR